MPTRLLYSEHPCWLAVAVSRYRLVGSGHKGAASRYRLVGSGRTGAASRYRLVGSGRTGTVSHCQPGGWVRIRGSPPDLVWTRVLGQGWSCPNAISTNPPGRNRASASDWSEAGHSRGVIVAECANSVLGRVGDSSDVSGAVSDVSTLCRTGWPRSPRAPSPPVLKVLRRQQYWHAP